MNAPLTTRLGLSTLFMPANGKAFLGGLDAACEHGWQALEIVPALHHGHSGYPRTRWCLGIDLDTISSAELDRISASAARFPLRTVHSMSVDVNISSRNAGIRAESVRQYVQCAGFAARIGARAVTFHPGLPRPGESMGDEAHVIEQNVAFGRRMAEFCEQHDMLAGYENLGGFPTIATMREIIDRIGSARFGLHLDIGHAWLVGPTDPLDWIRDLGSRIVTVHMHGTYHRPDRGFENHQSLALDECTDLPGVAAGLQQAGFDGPIIFEILAPDIPSYLNKAGASRDLFLAAAGV